MCSCAQSRKPVKFHLAGSTKKALQFEWMQEFRRWCSPLHLSLLLHCWGHFTYGLRCMYLKISNAQTTLQLF